MTLEMRELQGQDLFTVLGIVGKLNIKDNLVALFEEQDEKKGVPADHKKAKPTKAEAEAQQDKVKQRGMRIVAELIQTTLLNLGKVKGDINSLFADLTGKSVKEIEQLNLSDYGALLTTFFKKPELRGFIEQFVSVLQ